MWTGAGEQSVLGLCVGAGLTCRPGWPFVGPISISRVLVDWLILGGRDFLAAVKDQLECSHKLPSYSFQELTPS